MAIKVCVVGAGAVGGLFMAWMGKRLDPARVELSVLARGATLAALSSQGLCATHPDGSEEVIPVRASGSATELGPQDLVIATVKSPALPALAPALGMLLGAQGVLLQAMNGLPWWFAEDLPGAARGHNLRAVDPEGALAVRIPTSRVLGAVVHLAASQPQPGCVRHHSGNGLIIGEPSGGPSARLAELADLLGDAGFAVTPSERIQRDIWFKLWGNMTMNPVSALTGAPCDRILDDPLVRQFCSAVMLEAQAIGTAFGITIAQQPEERHAVTRKLGSFKTSMLQDVLAGRPLEIDGLVASVREIGAHLGLATPHIDALLGLVRLMASERGLYPRPG